jgi:glycosyltransferase involved in cell wall biosynthesis
MDSFEAELGFARSVLELAKPELLTAANDVYAVAAEKIVQGKTPVRVLPYPVDIDYFAEETDRSMRQELNVRAEEILILVPSRIIERKGIREAVYALAELPEGFHLCLPGAFEPLDTDFWKSITVSTEYKKVKDRVHIPSRKLQYNVMPRLYAACDIVAMPSYYEGAPVATVEAMASGKPFVGADSQGINGFIKDGINGSLVPAKDPSALALAIRQAAADMTRSLELARHAQDDIDWLSWNQQLPQVKAVYQELLAANRAREGAVL